MCQPAYRQSSVAVTEGLWCWEHRIPTGLLKKALGPITQHTDNTGKTRRRKYYHRTFKTHLGWYEIELFLTVTTPWDQKMMNK